MGLRRVSIERMSGLLRKPKLQRVGPLCLTCGRPVSEVQLKNEPGHDTHAEWLLRCHGAEEVLKMKMGSANWDKAEAGRLVNKQEWFDPHQLAGVTEER